MDLTEVLAAFEKFDGKYKRDQVTYALEHQEEITPYLINILKDILNNPTECVVNEDNNSHIYALILLGYFKETNAHQLIIDLFCIPNDLITELFGDVSLDNLPIVLYQTCGGSIENIKTLILNKSAPDTTRVSAVSSLLYVVAGDILSREEVLAFLGTLFSGDEADPESDFWSLVASYICDLCPDDFTLEIIKRAYEEGLITDGIVGYEEFEEVMELGVEKSQANNKQKMLQDIPENIHDTMSWWACFNENEPQFHKLFTASTKSTSSTNKKKKPKKKVKNKKIRAHKKKKKKKKRK